MLVSERPCAKPAFAKCASASILKDQSCSPMTDHPILGMRPALAERMIRFLLVGGLTFVAYYALLYILHTGAGMSYPLAIAISYGFALALHFLINRSFTFSGQRGRASQ